MTEEASADDFQVQDFLKKKKKKKRKYKEYDQEHKNDERESIQDAELCSASPPLLEDQAAQSGEGFKKKKRKKKQKKQQFLLGNSCVELEGDISNETGVDASQKKKKKKKWKHNDNTDEESSAVTCIAVNRSCSDICQKIDADYIYLKLPVKKKKQKLREEDEVCEVPESVKKKKRKEKLREVVEVCELPESIYLEPPLKKKKKRKEKLPEEDEVCELPESIYLEPPVKKKKRKEKLPEEDEVCEPPESICLEPPVKKQQKLPEEDEVCEPPESICLEPPVKKQQKLPEEDEVCELPESICLEPPLKKKKKKKRKEKLCGEDEVCEPPESIYLEPPVKKQQKLPEEDEVCEPPESIYLEPPVKKQQKLPEEDEVCEPPESICLEPPLKKKKKRKEKLREENEICELPECISLEPSVKKEERKEKLSEEDEVCEPPECVYLEPPLTKKKKKKRKEKLREENEIGELPECISLEPSVKKEERKEKLSEEDEVCELPECVYLEPPLTKKKKKKKRKEKLREENEIGELPECISLEPSVKKEERKEKLSEEDEVRELPISEIHDKNGSKRSINKKKSSSCTLDIQEAADVTVDQSLLSPAEQNMQGKGTELPLATEADGVALSPQCHENGDCDASPARREDFMDVPANVSKLSKAANQPPKNPPMRSKKIKSRAFITEESSSDSDVMTPKPLASNRSEDPKSSFTRTVTTDDGSPDDDDDEEYLNSTVCLLTDLDTAKRELEEFIPHVRNMSDGSVMKMAGRDLTRFKEFKKQGIAIKFGRFSQKENNQIRKNIEEFLKLTGIDSAEKVLFTSRYPEEKKPINRLKAEYLFCEKLSVGIPRPWRLIYYRARKIFDPNNYKGRYTKEEKEKLKKYYALHGNDWKKISEMMSRSNLSVAMKYSEIKSATNYGPWSEEEIQKLMRAVEEVLRKRAEVEDGSSNRDILIDREKLYQKLPWSEIETKVGTRYWRQCKQKWITILTNKLNRGQQLCRGTKGLQAKINLIKRLHELNVEDPNEVNWEELSDIMGDVPKAYVQAKFYKLKASCVPLWRRKTFSEITNYLYEKKLPELEEKLEKEKKKRRVPDRPAPGNSAPEQRKKVFRLSDIFDSSEESD